MIRSVPWFALALALAVSAAEVEAQYQARPVITSVSPTSGPPGTVVTISGQNLSSSYKVFYNGVELKTISASATAIKVQLPPDAVQGRFTLQGPVHKVVSPQVFWVVQAKAVPVITEISPTFGPPGTVVTLKGNNFSTKSHENTVMIGGSAMAVRSSNATRIQAVVPVGAQTGNISVQVYGAGQATAPQSFTVLAQLMIESFEPAMGPPGTHVKLRGSGFSTKKNLNKVHLGDALCKVIGASTNELVVIVPQKGAETARFRVDVKGLGSYEHPAQFPVVYPPEVSSFTPVAGNIGTEVSISGTHFGNNAQVAQVLITGRECQVMSLNDNEIRVRIPQGAVSGPFKIIIPNMGTAQSSRAFEVWAPLAVTRMDPLFGLPGTEVKLYGSGFRASAADHTLYLGADKVKIEKVENGALVFEIPKSAPDGPVTFRLEVKERGATMVPMTFTVMHAPEVSGFEPSRGPVGTAVAINGNYFGTKVNHVRVLLGGQIVPATSVTPTQITLTIPPGAVSGQFEVQTVRRGSDVSKKTFEVFVPVRVTSFLPSLGYSGQTVHLFGSGFDPNKKLNKVTLEGKQVPVLEASPTRLKIKLPKGSASGSFRVEVSGRGFSETMQKFKVVEKLSIKSFDPIKGVPGDYVTIKGRGFENTGLRGYIGNAPIGVRVDSPTKVTIAVPPNAETDKFVFTAPGAGRAESTQKFKVLVPLTISGFQPAYGPAGTKVSIYGSGFDLRPNRTRVSYGRQAIKVESGSTETMLIVTVPKGADDSPFVVKVKGRGNIESENMFSVVKPLPPPAPVMAAPPPTMPAYAPPAPGAPVPVAGSHGAPTVAPTPAYPSHGAPPTGAPTAGAQPPTSAPVASGGPPQPAPAPVTPTPTTAAPPTSAPAPTTPESMDDLLGVKEKTKITSIDPTEGMVGDFVMVSGTGFGSDPSVIKAWVGKVPAVVSDVMPDMIMLEIPAGVRRGAIKIKVGDALMAKSSQLLTVVEPE